MTKQVKYHRYVSYKVEFAAGLLTVNIEDVSVLIEEGSSYLNSLIDLVNMPFDEIEGKCFHQEELHTILI